ncbi:helix-turn-helix domain-containing protein [Peribacillus alkalitolerans]|uniref:helix-turn-helix domain-containing protein n=1 Tax=Peribacillus alkalitolerans TaxID=1550385 RepID=UPI0013D174A2|nr:helix-turn-helix domain-containing protein [Peribacillus alkalitolerans]
MRIGITDERKALFFMLGQELDAKACKILILMIGMSDSETGMINTSLSDLHKKTKMAVTTIRRALDNLKDAGVLEVSHNPGVESEYRLKLAGAIQDRANKMVEEYSQPIMSKQFLEIAKEFRD